ncbi:DeoR/GlpR family DNA-binding transcription regulator [Brachybacterium saurashtrense]|uniref:DeoR/GlpR transcriptional regulator n=1 Tax=Brachybacterium saurashtrense TaxID=556288 RepID=A0A345YJW4_9MICO|nr:DeoR/GlpR family DNA-binding transcription regulator [Brachybacterium saurashtrense]AXK44216.1 DeoR/GlpR transcriptional regulator [Brachybacterium saurashtrense]RRR21488.1 DeoR/GlpR transcriptional regulator [Brachybacterium saurashtrense]
MPPTDEGADRHAPPVRGRRARLDHVLDLIIEEGHLGVDDLIERLGISPATARRDLDTLAEQQLVIRTHGGASAHPDASALPMRYRAARNAGAKEAIARCAVELAEPGSVLGLNGGTTTTALAQELAAHPAFREAPRQTVLVTNAINIAQELAVRRHLQLVVTGGVVKEASFELVGSWAEQLLAQIRIDTLFLGVDGLTAVDGARTHDEAEASISARLIERSTRVVVLADAEKIGTGAFARIVPTTGIHDLVTEESSDPEVLAALREAGVRVHLAPAEHGRAG